jgi:hypothetical protein
MRRSLRSLSHPPLNASIVRRTTMRGTAVSLACEGEGWFPGVVELVIRGRIEDDLGSAHGGGSWVVVRLDHALEVQERGHETPSGFRLVRYERLLVRPRHVGVSLVGEKAVSTHVCLLPDGADPAKHLGSVRGPDVCASCTLGA